MQSFKDALASLESALAGPLRRRIVDEVSKARSFDRSARHLRDSMRAHRFEALGQPLFAAPWVRHFDQMTRADGFHILHDWDGQADRFRSDSIPVEVASLAERVASPADSEARRAALLILLDYYFLHLLALLALRVWDEGSADENLAAIDRSLGLLQGRDGSGQKFARDAETLILIATSHFEPDVTAYDRLLARVRKLDRGHRLNLAIVHGGILGRHLQFGLQVTCAGNILALREDNVPDYPWLGEALSTLLAEYTHTKGHKDDGGLRFRITEALLVALSPDPDAFLGAPAAPETSDDERAKFRADFRAQKADLLRDLEAHRPAEDAYSPLSLTFNFPHNLVKGIVVDAVLRGVPWTLGFDDLLTAFPKTPALSASRHELALRLMSYALSSPDTIRGKPHPAIVYDPRDGLRSFERTLGRLASDL